MPYIPHKNVQQRDIERILEYIQKNLSYLNIKVKPEDFNYHQDFSTPSSRKYTLFPSNKSKTTLNFDVSDAEVKNVP